MQIQSHLASTIAMAFDECIENPSPKDYVERSVDRTARWLGRCKAELERLNSLPETINREQLLFGINQGSTFEDVRIRHAQEISELDLRVTRSAGWPWARATRKCTISWISSCRICRLLSPLT